MYTNYSIFNNSETLKHTPILINYQTPVISADELVLKKEHDNVGITLKIVSPSSGGFGAQQIISQTTILRIPSDGRLRLKLFPSNYYSPMGRYKVEFYAYGKTTPIDIQSWIVPIAPTPVTTTITHSADGDFLILPPYLTFEVFNIISTSFEGPFELVDHQIVWTETQPTVGEEITIVYQPAVTLAMVNDKRTSGVDRRMQTGYLGQTI